MLDKFYQMPVVNLGIFPTPVTRLLNFEKAIGYEKIYMKRDDMTGLGPGGNKIRSLEYIFGEAAQKGADTIVVAGPLQSNLCTLTACACAKADYRCVVVHNGAEPECIEGNLLLNKLLNVETHYLGDVSSAERNAYAEELTAKLAVGGTVPYLIENGATTGIGALGYVSAVVELYRQTKELGLEITSIFAPGGNGGVATGLIFGNVLLGNPFEINIISVEYDRSTLRHEILSVIAQMENVLGMPFQRELDDVCNLIEDYRGEGWGANTIESELLVHRFPQMEGVFIENVYNSKVLVGLEDMARKRKISGNACYLHTGGFGSLFSQYS